MNNNKFGKRLLDARINKKYTQEYLAEKVGTVASYISNMERKNLYPSLTMLRKISKELDVSYDYLLMDDFEIDKQLEIKYNEIFRTIKEFDYTTQEEFFNIVNSLLTSFKNLELNNR